MLSVYSVSFTDNGSGSGMESEVFGSVFLSMTLLLLLMGPVSPVESFLNFWGDPGFLSGGLGFS